MNTSVLHRRRRIFAAISAILFQLPLHAATVTVNSADDAALGTVRHCTLRSALASIDAGSATPSCADSTQGTFGSSDTVSFSDALRGATVTLTQGELAIHRPTTLLGGGQTIDASYLSRVIDVVDTSLVASDLTLTHGKASGSSNPAKAGGGIRATGATLSLTRVNLMANTAAGEGGGIYFNNPNGALDLDTVEISDNTASRVGGAWILGDGLEINRSRVTGNTGDRAGGIAVTVNSVAGVHAAIRSSTFSNNTATCQRPYCAGGLYFAGPGQLYIGASTVSGNQASGPVHYLVGGVYVYGGVATMVNSTIANNTATGTSAVGGGFVVGGISELHGQQYAKDALTLTQFTVSGNTAVAGNAGGAVGGGVVSGAQTLAVNAGFVGALALENTLVAGNLPAGSDVNTHYLTAGTVLSATYSVLGSGANASPFNDPANHNRFSDAPGLAPLADNGGPTLTMALLASSPALAAGSPALAQYDGTPLLHDQRGPNYPRWRSGTVDIGAFEDQGDRIFGDGFE